MSEALQSSVLGEEGLCERSMLTGGRGEETGVASLAVLTLPLGGLGSGAPLCHVV